MFGQLGGSLISFDHVPQDVKHSCTTRTPVPNSLWIGRFQKVTGVLDFVVPAFLSVAGCFFQGIFNIHFFFFLKVLPVWKSLPLKALPVVLGQSIAICNEPGFHDLNHQMNCIIFHFLHIPSVSLCEMISG